MKSLILLFLLCGFAASLRLSGQSNQSVKQFYVEHTLKANWFAAQQFCRKHGSHLASLNSEEEHNQVKTMITNVGMTGESFWIGGNDLAQEGKFWWISNGQPIIFNKFYSTPDNHRGSQHCVQLWAPEGLNWDDQNCGEQLYFVCETIGANILD